MYKYPYDLDTPILFFEDEPKEFSWTIRDSFTHMCGFGGTGSGKTSAPCSHIIFNMMKLSYGGIVLCAKTDDLDMYVKLAKKANRENDLIVLSPENKNYFNVFEYLSRSNRPAGITITENIVDTLQTILQSSQQKSGQGSDDWFWQSSLTQVLTYACDVAILATGKLSVQDLYNIVITAPQDGEEPSDESRTDNFHFFYREAEKRVNQLIQAFRNKLSLDQTKEFQKDDVKFQNAIFKAIPEALLLRQIHNFFFENYKTLSSKTKSIVSFSFSGFLFSMLREPMYSLFSGNESTFSPEACFDGKIIIFNLPTMIYNKVGRDIQSMCKYITQRAWEKRNLEENNRPLFIVCDEAHEFLHPADKVFQATCRSNHISVIYFSQNLPNFYASMGGSQSEYNVKALLGNFGSKMFLANADSETNRFSSELMGNAYQKEKQWSSSISGSFSSTQTESYKLERIVRPESFVGLKTGGPLNRYVVSGYLHRQGRGFKDGTNFKKIYFSQF